MKTFPHGWSAAQIAKLDPEWFAFRVWAHSVMLVDNAGRVLYPHDRIRVPYTTAEGSCDLDSRIGSADICSGDNRHYLPLLDPATDLPTPDDLTVAPIICNLVYRAECELVPRPPLFSPADSAMARDALAPVTVIGHDSPGPTAQIPQPCDPLPYMAGNPSNRPATLPNDAIPIAQHVLRSTSGGDPYFVYLSLYESSTVPNFLHLLAGRPDNREIDWWFAGSIDILRLAFQSATLILCKPEPFDDLAVAVDQMLVRLFELRRI